MQRQIVILVKPFLRDLKMIKLKNLMKPFFLFIVSNFVQLVDAELEVIPMVVRMLVFHAVRGAEKDVLRSGSLITTLVSKFPRLSPQRYSIFQEVFLHPYVLEHFHPLQPSSSDNLTPLVMSLAPVTDEDYHWLLKPYKQR